MLSACVLSVLCATSAQSTPLKSIVNASQLRAGLLEAQNRIHSIYVMYMCDDYDGARVPTGLMLRRVVAAKAPDRVLHMTAHGHDTVPWTDDPFQQRARIVNGHLYNEYPFNNAYYESSIDLKEKGLPGTLPGEFLFNATGVWPLPGVKPPRPNELAFVLKDVAVDAGYNVVRSHQELIDGHWCHVLERPGVDRLWVDVERGYTLLARETHAITTGRLAQRIELGGHLEVRPMIWFPSWMTNIQYDHNSTDQQTQRRIWKVAKHDVLEVRINDVDDTLFQWEPPPGSLRVVDDGPSVQVKPGGMEHLDSMASWIRRHHTIRANKPRLSVGEAKNLVQVAVGVIGITVCVSVLVRRKADIVSKARLQNPAAR